MLTNEYLQTSNNRIYAAGDVTLGPQFVYVAAYEGGIVANNALGLAKRKIDLRFVPGVTFTNPSIATVGLTEQQAKKRLRCQNIGPSVGRCTAGLSQSRNNRGL